MTAPRRYSFEGRDLTFSQIRALVPAIGPEALRIRLNRGAASRQQVLAVDERALKRRAGRLGRAASDAAGYGFKFPGSPKFNDSPGTQPATSAKEQ